MAGAEGRGKEVGGRKGGRRTSRRPCAGLWLAACALLLAGGCSGPPSPRFDNLVVVMIDTLRSDHLPSYGYERDTAPFLGRLAAEGIQLQGYAASSWTRPSVATLLTGLHPQRHQTISRSDRLPADLPYLPALLESQGFATAAFAGNRNVGSAWGFGRGFAAFGQAHATGKIDGERVTDHSLGLLIGLKPPYFLYVHYVDPHDPYRPGRPWPDEADTEPAGYVQPRQIEAGRTPLNETTVRRMINQYDGEIREMDDAIRRLFEALEAQGLLRRTLVVITADHGEEFTEHGGLTHGHTLFEEVLQVPFILWASPGSGLPAYRSEERFHQVDLLPTALEALSLEGQLARATQGLDGTSRWRQILERRSPAGDDLYFHLDLDRRGGLALLRGSAKLIHDRDRPHNRLYDLAEDPLEKAPTASLDSQGQALLEDLIRHHNRQATLASRREATTADDEERQAMAALGYLQMDTPEEELGERVVPRQLPRGVGFGGLE